MSVGDGKNVGEGKFTRVQAKALFDEMDARDGNKDGKILKSIWDTYQQQVHCNGIVNYIEEAEAIKTILKYENKPEVLEMRKNEKMNLEQRRKDVEFSTTECAGDSEKGIKIDDLKEPAKPIEEEVPPQLPKVPFERGDYPEGHKLDEEFQNHLKFEEKDLKNVKPGLYKFELVLDKFGKVIDVDCLDKMPDVCVNRLKSAGQSLLRFNQPRDKDGYPVYGDQLTESRVPLTLEISDSGTRYRVF